MAWYHRLFNAVRSDRHASDVEREMQFHLEQRADDLAARGMTPSGARYEASRRFGNRTAIGEATRRVDHFAWTDTLRADVRYALRAVARSPLIFLVATLSMALGIGANIAIFSLVNALMLRPLPVRDPQALVQITDGPDQKSAGTFTNPIWEQIRAVPGVFDGAFAYSADRYNLANGGLSERVDGVLTSGGLFTTLGVQAAAGRLFSAADDVPGCDAVVVLGYRFWQKEFGGAASAIGRSMYIENAPFRVIGIAAESFLTPQPGTGADIFMPLCANDALEHAAGTLNQRANWFLTVIGRLAPGITLQQAQASLLAHSPAIFANAVPTDWPLERQRDFLKRQLWALPGSVGVSNVRSSYRPALLLLMGVVGIVLLIACANVAQLLVARAAARRREIAIRLAIGASRLRIGRQLLTEGFLLALSSAIAGTLFARWAAALLVRGFSVGGSPVVLDLHLDVRALLFAIAVAMFTGVVFGLAPAFGTAHADPHDALRAGGRSSGSRLSVRFGRGLVVTQVALSLVLVATAGLLLGSFRRLANTDPGFRPDGMVLVGVDASSVPGGDSTHALAQQRLLERLKQLPGVSGVSASETTPLDRGGRNDLIVVDGYKPAKPMDALVFIRITTPGYLATMGTPVLAGRDFNQHDQHGAEPVVLIDEATAKHFFGSVNAVGRTLRIDPERGQTPLLRVVGIVANAKYSSMTESLRPTLYLPMGQAADDGVGGIRYAWRSFELRTTASAATLTPLIAHAAREVHPAIVLDVTTMNTLFATSISTPRLVAGISTFFGVLALLLALVGLYGIVSYSVSLRRKEIGIRLALGAARSRVVRMVLIESSRLAIAGSLLGLALTLATTRFVKALLYGVTATDPLTIGAAAITLLAVALIAGSIPAWRAARVNPMTTLREE